MQTLALCTSEGEVGEGEVQTLYFLTRTIVTLFQETFTVPYYTSLFTPQTFSCLI